MNSGCSFEDEFHRFWISAEISHFQKESHVRRWVHVCIYYFTKLIWDSLKCYCFSIIRSIWTCPHVWFIKMLNPICDISILNIYRSQISSEWRLLPAIGRWHLPEFSSYWFTSFAASPDPQATSRTWASPRLPQKWSFRKSTASCGALYFIVSESCQHKAAEKTKYSYWLLGFRLSSAVFVTPTCFRSSNKCEH